MHYTDRLPPPQILDEFPNWKYDVGKETRPGCHEHTLWVHRKKDKIYGDVDLTAGDVYFSDGSSSPALIGVRGGTEAEFLYVIGAKGIWSIENFNAGDFEKPNYLWRVRAEKHDTIAITMKDKSIFPIKFCSRLPHVDSSKTVTGSIDANGVETAWDVSSLWDAL